MFGVKYILCIWKWLLLIVYFFVIIEMYIKDFVCGWFRRMLLWLVGGLNVRIGYYKVYFLKNFLVSLKKGGIVV